MKKFTKIIKKIKKLDFFLITNQIIEHRLFKPISIAIITSFVLLHAFNYSKNALIDYRESVNKKEISTPIKIKVLLDNIKFDIKEDQVTQHQVRPGDTMLKILIDVGASEQDVFDILEAMKKVYNPKSLSSEDEITIKYKLKIDYNAKKTNEEEVVRSAIISSIKLSPSPENEVLVERQKDGTYKAREIKIKLTRQIAKYLGVINDGLFVDGVEAGVSANTMMNMINLYSYDVDFQRDIHDGDKFEVIVESFYNQEGKKIKDGSVLFSSLTLSGRPIEIYNYTIDGKNEYFDAKGNSVRKSLLRTPINGARVSSGFGMRRHPVLGYSRLHKGIDFAAPSGTPIYAAGAGTITYYGVKGGYGNFVQIRHNTDYSTAYGHASRFVSKLRVGSKVRQGEVVAYVGSTGRSTGPHLHFEVMVKGTAVNPSKVKATSGLKLAGKELVKFKNVKAEIDGYRKNIPNQIKN